MRKSYKVSLVIALLFPLFSMFQVKSSFAADTSTTVGDVQIPPSAVIKTVGTDPKEVSYYSNSDKLSYTTVTVNPPAGKTVTRVVLRKKNKQEIRDLPLVSGNQYQLGDIEGERVNLAASEEVQDGYFGWFRAPNRQKIWMYDLNNVRHYFLNTDVYPKPGTDAWEIDQAISAPAPATSEFTSRGTHTTSEGNIAWAERSWTFITTELEAINGELFNIEDVSNIEPDYQYLHGGEDYINEDDVLETKTITKDMANKQLIFQFRARYQIDTKLVYPTPDGLVIKFLNKWNVTFKGVVYKYSDMEIVYYTDDTPPGPKCEFNINDPSKGPIYRDEAMDPQTYAVLKADHRGGELFDVAKGIPTSEHLYANAFGLNYLFKNEFAHMTGDVTYKVNVKRIYVWTVPAGKGFKTVTKLVQHKMTVTRPYSYWQIDNLEVYKLQKATISNYALGGYGGTVTLDTSGYLAPTLQSHNNDDVDTHVRPAYCDDVDLGTGGGEPPPGIPSDFQSAAEGAVGDNSAKNDLVIFNGETIMENAWHPIEGQEPISIPQPVEIDQDVLYRNSLIVSNALINQPNQPTTGEIYYPLIPGNIKGGSDQTFDIMGINPVTVHTPVVMYPSVSDDQPHNQKVTPTQNRAALILDRPFVVRIPTIGQHNAYPGFGGYGEVSGYGEYAKYTRQKQVRFPFDVWNKDKTQYIPKETWIDIPVNQLDTTFIMPVWIDEGLYDVAFRSIAINSPVSGFTWETSGNFHLENHVATRLIPVEVIGRLYDFHITDIADYDWKNVFRNNITKSHPNGSSSGVSYWVGKNGIDGDLRGNSDLYTLPIHPGSHPAAGYDHTVSIKTGYHFKFDFKTKGNMFGQSDSVRITPTFYFVNKDGSGRRPVDLYYHDTSSNKPRYFIKIGSEADKVQRYVILNDPLRNVPGEEITDAANYAYDNYGTNGMSRSAFMADYFKKAGKKTSVGGFSQMNLSAPIRTFIGPKASTRSWIPDGVNAQRAYASIQKWYGEYSLPASPYVVAAGTNVAEYGRTHNGLTDDSPIFLRDGYIIVNFNIETIRNADQNHPHLRYWDVPLDNQWKMEGYKNTTSDKYGHSFSLQDGDVVFYHADLSSYDDFGVEGTH